MIIKLDIREGDLEIAFATACGLDSSYKNITIEKENLPIGDIIIYSDEGEEIAIIERKTLLSCRKYAVLIFFILSAIITPPDVISQIAIAIPMYMLYELTLLFTK